MTKTFGPDVSHWEGDIDWSLVPSDPDNPLDPQYFIFKATEGTGFVDDEFLENKQGAIQYGFPFASYHFFLPAYDPILQAEHFVNTVGEGCAVYVLDLERALLGLVLEQQAKTLNMASSPEGVNESLRLVCGLSEYPPELKAAMDSVIIGYDPADGLESRIYGLPELVKTFLDRLEQLTGKIPVIYTSPGFWNTYMLPTPAWTSDYPLWVAHWGVIEPTLPNGWTSYVLHQWGTSGRIPGIPGACDQNWFLGDLADVWAFFEYAPEPPTTIKIKVNSSYRRAVTIFSKPNLASAGLGLAYAGSEWDDVEKISGEDNRDYYKLGGSRYLPAALCTELTP